MARGHTLIELALVVTILAMVVASLLPIARKAVDVTAAVGSREALAGFISEARLRALGTGDVDVTLAAGPWRAWTTQGDSVVARLGLEEEWGVEVALANGRMATTLAYDALGLGRIASQTIRLRRGQVERALIVSGYGRVRRR